MRRRKRPLRWLSVLAIALLVAGAVWTLVPTAIPAWFLRQTVYPVAHVEQIRQSSAQHGVDPYLACAVIKRESNWNVSASSQAGAQGLMQLLPSTAAEMARLGLVDATRYDPANLFDPATNIEYGCAYLSWLSARCDSLDEVIAAYNAGPGIVSDWMADGAEGDEVASLVKYPETRVYLARVKDAYIHYQELYPDGI